MHFASPFGEWLAGIRVLDFTAVLAGPHLARALAQAGAEVIKIEPLPSGDTTRGLPYRYDGGQSGYFKQQNIGKLGLAVNLASDEGHRIAMGLAAQSHIVTENFRPGVVNTLRVGYEDIRAVRPDIVYASISGWGQTGPYAQMTGEVRSTTGLSGLMAPDRDGHAPAWERCSFGDTNASIHALAAIGAGLYRARTTGQSTYIDMSILEGLMSANALELPEVLAGPPGALTGREHRTGGDHARVVSGTFRTYDGMWVFVRAIEQHAWAALAKLLGLPEEQHALLPAARRPLAPTVYALLEAYCDDRPLAELVRDLPALGISAVPVRQMRDALADPATREAGLIQEVPDAYVGQVTVPTGLFASRAFGMAPQRPEPLLGQHCRDVLTRLLGYSDADVDSLLAAGIITQTIPPEAGG
jgi:crotonobetainyl-CoA:carnitine CoA-transferase CaiB-like acyl-CoA transferase